MTQQSAVHAAWKAKEAERCADADIALALTQDDTVAAAVCDPSNTED